MSIFPDWIGDVGGGEDRIIMVDMIDVTLDDEANVVTINDDSLSIILEDETLYVEVV